MPPATVENVEPYIADALKKGAPVVTGGKRAARQHGGGSSFVEPTVLTDVTTDMAPLYRFKADDEAISMANETPTLPSPVCGGGKGGGRRHFYSRDIGRIWRVAEALEYGIVGINEGIISPNPLARSRPSAT